MKAYSVGEILQEAVHDSNVEIYQETHFGDSFESFTHHQTHQYDLEEFTAVPTGEELASLRALLEFDCNSILDIGAGSGRISKWLIGEGKKVKACEIDPACIQLCRENGIMHCYEGDIANINEMFDACILAGGGIPLIKPTSEPLNEVYDFFSLIRSKIKDGGYFLLDVCNYTHHLFNPVNGYKVSTIRFSTHSRCSEPEYYIYPSQHQISAIMYNLGFENIFHVVETYSAGDPDVYRHYSIWRKKDDEKRQSSSNKYALRWN